MTNLFQFITFEFSSPHLRATRRAYKAFAKNYKEIQKKKKGPAYFTSVNNNIPEAAMDKNMLYFNLAAVSSSSLNAQHQARMDRKINDLDKILELEQTAEDQCRNLGRELSTGLEHYN